MYVAIHRTLQMSAQIVACNAFQISCRALAAREVQENACALTGMLPRIMLGIV